MTIPPEIDDSTSDRAAAPPPPPNDAPPASLSPLVRYLDGLVEQLREHVAGVLQTEQIESVHQSRVATRRLKAAADLLEPLLSNKSRRSFNQLLRRIRRRLGPVRDIDVMIGHLHDLTGDDGCPAGADWLVEELEHDRLDAIDDARSDKSLVRLVNKLRPWNKLRRQIEGAGDEAIDSLLAESLHRQIDEFAGRAAELDASHTGGADGTEASTSVDPHAVRIAGKALRYTVEMAQVAGHPLPEDMTRSFKKMQDALGLWHDHVVLTEQAMLVSAEGLVAHHNLALQRSVLEVAQASLTEASRQLDKFTSIWRESGPRLVDAIRAAFPPLSREAIRDAASGDNGDPKRPGTDRDPDGSSEPQSMDGPH
jgi:CHAD domain-containing protein